MDFLKVVFRFNSKMISDLVIWPQRQLGDGISEIMELIYIVPFSLGCVVLVYL